MKILRKILWLLVYALPAVLFFSYHPVISLGANQSMNFELSLPLLWLVIFDLLSFIYLIIYALQLSRASATAHTSKSHLFTLNLIGISDRRFFLFTLFPLYATISVFWSPNPLRGLLTAGIIWLLFYAIFSLLYVLPLGGRPRRLRFHVLLVMFIAAVLVCKFCYAQSIMDVAGLSRDTSLLCLGCTYRSFGFPHPSGFAIEPQFMGNLLLAPTLVALYMVAFRPRKFAKNMIAEAEYLEKTAEHQLLQDKIHLPRPNWKRWQFIGMVVLAGFLSLTLFFTFSRGAIYAYAIAILILIIFALKRHQFSWTLITIPVVSFILSLGLQGTFAAVGPTVETFTSAVTKSIHQLSLGLIDLRSLATNVKDNEDSTSSDNSTKAQETSQDSTNSSHSVENSEGNCGKLVDKSAETVDNSTKNVENQPKNVENSQNSVDNSTENCAKPVQNPHKTVEELAKIVDKSVENHEEKSAAGSEKAQESAIFEGYVPESTNIRLSLNAAALETWLSAPGHPQITTNIGCFRPSSAEDPQCASQFSITPTSMLFGVGLGGAGTAMHARTPDKVTSPKEIVQNQPFSLLLETGIIGILLALLGLVIAFWPQIFPAKFLDGRAASATSSTETTFWHHPALPLLVSLIVAYLITLNFFSGLPNALHIYLMPPLLYLIFQDSIAATSIKSQNPSKNRRPRRSAPKAAKNN